MTDWKTGEPPEDGWYWVTGARPGLHGMPVGFTEVMEWGMAAWWACGIEDGDWPGDPMVNDWRWQGPLVPPDPPEVGHV